MDLQRSVLAEAAFSVYPRLLDVDFRLPKLFFVVTAVPPWEFMLLMIIAGTVFLYHILEMHFVGDVLGGWRGDRASLYYNPTSRVSSQMLSKCEVIKGRFWPTPWLSGPHFQTLFLHFFGRSPQVDYQRQLYITSDGGTIALDWVKSPTFSEDGGGDRQQNLVLDEIPTAIIVPGLTSDSGSHYVKHAAASFSDKGWRVLVANHRGLGGVSLTSDQFYNAGWTEDLRNTILFVKQKFPKSPLVAVGTSIGANILVKYLGEEGPRTPLCGAIAICCPWDLLVCDRFMRRKGLQALYNKALAVGLQGYAQLHQTAISRMVDWEIVRKSASIRDFDDNCTRHVGKYETVDTYYRKCSSAQYIETVTVPLLCISAEDDPICTKDAIPYDECRVNPNVILGVTRHGGHLGYYEGFDATSIWYVRAATEFARVVLSSSLLHQHSKVADIPTLNLGSKIDKGPFLTMGDDLRVAAQVSGHDGNFVTTALKNGKLSGFSAEVVENEISTGDQGSYVGLDNPVNLGPSSAADDVNCIVSEDYGGPLFTPGRQTSSGKPEGIKEDLVISNETGVASISTDGDVGGQPFLTLKLRSPSEVAALRSALTQLLDQVPVCCSIANECSKAGGVSKQTLSQSQTVALPITSSVVSGFGKCVDAVKDLLVDKGTKGKTTELLVQRTEKVSEHPGPVADLASQNRRTLWLLTYVALVTTFPFLGSALLIHTRGKIGQVLSRAWLKRTP